MTSVETATEQEPLSSLKLVFILVALLSKCQGFLKMEKKLKASSLEVGGKFWSFHLGKVSKTSRGGVPRF